MKGFVYGILAVSLLTAPYVKNPTLLPLPQLTAEEKEWESLLEDDLLFEVTKTKYAQEDEFCVRGVDAFSVEEDGTLWILSAGERRMICVKPGEEKQISEFLLVESEVPADFLWYQEELYVYDSLQNALLIYDRNGTCLYTGRADLTGDYVEGIKEAADGIVLTTYGGKELVISDRNTAALAERKSTATEYLPEDGENCDFHQVLTTDGRGTVYSVHTQVVPEVSVLTGEISIRGTTVNRQDCGTYYLDTSEYVYLPRRFLYATKHGTLYLLVNGEQTAQVKKIELSKQADSRYEEIKACALKTEQEYQERRAMRVLQGVAFEEIVTITRGEALKRMWDMLNYSWTLTEDNVDIPERIEGFGKIAGKVILPPEIQAAAERNQGKEKWSEPMTGIPYCWGGFASLYGGNYNRSFPYAMRTGFVAGNVKSDEKYYVFGTSGIDCSGFACAVYDISVNSKVSTRSMADLGTEVTDWRSMELLDYLVYAADHVILFCEYLDEGTILVAEATIRDGKTIYHPRSLNGLIAIGKYEMRTPWQ